MRVSGSIVLGFALSPAGCLSREATVIPPASPASLACALNQLSKLGYLINAPSPGSAWQQAYRGRDGGGEEIWVRLVDEGRRAAWLDLRQTSWGQFHQTAQPEGNPRPFIMRGEQAQEDIRTVREVCLGTRGGSFVARRP